MRRLPLLSALAALALTTLACAAPVPFPQAESDLKADPAITFGTLPNGLRYVVMPNHEPKGRASLRLLVLAGSFNEKENQRGLAHFLEHMAFNGSTHYAPGTLVEKLQRLGMGFGADTNAATSFDHTIYQLELPATDPKTMSEGLQILADYSGGLLLQDNMVDKERGIILSEKRTRDSVGYRTFIAGAEFMQAGTRVPERIPIGLEDVITKSNRDPFVDFYNTWYRPEKMVVIVVGDIDPASVEKEIGSQFTPIAARSPEPAATNLGSVAVFSGVKALYHHEPESGDTQIVIASVTPYAHERDDTATRIKYLPRYLAMDMLNERFDILSKKDHAFFTRANANVEESFNLYREASIEINCKAGQWREALGVGDLELRRAMDFGFRPDELKQAVANFQNNIEQAEKTASTRRSDGLAGDIAESLVDREVFTSPADDLALYGAALRKITEADCLAALRDAWSSPGRYVYVSGNVDIALGGDAIVANIYKNAETVTATPTTGGGNLTWGYGDFGAPGAVSSRQHIDDLDLTEVVFANGVRLNIKKTDFEANTEHVSVRIGTGQMTEPAATEPGLSTFTGITFSVGGLGKHSVTDLQRILAGKNVGALFSSTPDAFQIIGDTNRKDQDLEFQLLAASVKDPGYRPEAMRTARKRIEAAYQSYEHTERGPLNLHVAKMLASGDPRFGLPSENEMMSRTLDEEKAWLTPQLSTGPIEIAVAGDVDVDAVIASVAKTFGTLQARDPKPPLPEKHKVSFPSVPFSKEYGLDTKIPKGIVAIYWPTNDGLDIHRQRRLNILAEVLSDRLRIKVREQMGSTYSPIVGSTASDVFPGYGYITSMVVVDPSKTEDITGVVVGVASEIRTGGITQDELDRTKNPAMTALKESERTNNYWMTVLGRAQERPETLEWARSRRDDFQSISKAELDALAQLYFSPKSASKVVIKPYITNAGASILQKSGPAQPASQVSPVFNLPLPGKAPTPTPPPDGE
ncbi:MAG TPA: insulinase family protein [Opitutaceae bacterium]|jgi:zinc protease|nr:insulinase family protein [Opitutaceae bacterium]